MHSAHVDYFRVYAGNPTTEGSSFSIAPANVSHPEGNTGTTAFAFTVTLSASTASADSVAWAVVGSGSNPANAADFARDVLPSGTVSFAAGQTQKTITVNVAGDKKVEPNEQFTVTLSHPSSGTTIGTASATGTIVNDDGSKSANASAAAVSANVINPTQDQMQFITPGNSARATASSVVSPGQNLADGAGSDMLSGLTGSSNVSDLLPQLRTPVDHTTGAPIVGINFGLHHSTGNLAVIDPTQHPTLPL